MMQKHEKSTQRITNKMHGTNKQLKLVTVTFNAVRILMNHVKVTTN